MSNPTPTNHSLDRRTLVRGAAWTTPMIVVAGTAPAFAVSPTPTLGGSLTFSRSSTADTCTITLGGADPSVLNSQGVWVSDAEAKTPVTGLRMVVYLPTVWSGATIARGTNGKTSWSPLTQLSSISNPPVGMPNDYVAFETSYSGAWSYDAANRALLAVDRPFFSLTRRGACASALVMYVRRTAMVGTAPQTIDRSRTL